MVRGDTIGILSAAFLQADCVVTPVSTNTALEKAKVARKVVRTRIGSPFVIEGMVQAAEDPVVVGFEANGGLLLGSNIIRRGAGISKLPTRDSVLPILCCLALACERNQSLSDLVALLPARYTDSDLLRDFPVERKAEIYKAALEGDAFKKTFVTKHGAITEQDETDGLRLTFADGQIVHFRPSGNAPEFRCYAEAESPAAAKALVAEGLAWLAQQFKSNEGR
jgi:phosphomannomutase